MTLKNWMAAKAIVCVAFGVALVLLPGTLLSLWGVSLDDGGLLMAQLGGASFLVLAILLWLNRNAHEAATRQAFSIAVFVGDLAGAVVLFVAQLSGVMNALGWATVLLYLVLALGFGYFLLPGKAESDAKVALR